MHEHFPVRNWSVQERPSESHVVIASTLAHKHSELYIQYVMILMPTVLSVRAIQMLNLFRSAAARAAPYMFLYDKTVCISWERRSLAPDRVIVNTFNGLKICMLSACQSMLEPE